MLSDFRSVLTGDVVGKGMTALSLFVAIRYLTPSELANYVYFAGIAAAAYAFFNGFFNRQFLFSREHRSHVAGYRFVAAALTFTGCAVLLGFAQVRDPWLVVPTIALAIAAMDYEFKRTVLQQAGHFNRFAVTEASRAALFLLLTVAVIACAPRDRPALLLFAQAGSYLLALAFIRLEATQGSAVRQQVSAVLRSIIGSKPAMLMAYFILVGLFGQLPILLYKPLATELQYAELGSAFRYYGLLMSVATAVNVVSLPKIADAEGGIGWDILASMRNVFLISVLLVAVAVVAGFFAIPIIDGGAYPAAPVHFALLSLGTLIGVFVGPISALYLRSRLGFLLLTQVGAVASAATVILLLAGESSRWAAAALPIGIFVQLCALLIGSGGAYRMRRGATS